MKNLFMTQEMRFFGPSASPSTTLRATANSGQAFFHSGFRLIQGKLRRREQQHTEPTNELLWCAQPSKLSYIGVLSILIRELKFAVIMQRQIVSRIVK